MAEASLHGRIHGVSRQAVPGLTPDFTLLRNSTIFATQKSGFGQCSQKAPAAGQCLKQRPEGSDTPDPTQVPQ